MKERTMKYVSMENFQIVEILNEKKFHSIFEYEDYIKKVDYKPAPPMLGIDENLTELRFSLFPGLVFKMEYQLKHCQYVIFWEDPSQNW